MPPSITGTCALSGLLMSTSELPGSDRRPVPAGTAFVGWSVCSGAAPPRTHIDPSGAEAARAPRMSLSSAMSDGLAAQRRYGFLVDTVWMRTRLVEYLSLCEKYDDQYRRNNYEYTDALRDLNHQAERLQPTVERVLRALDPTLVEELTPLGYDVSNIAGRIRQALGVIDDRDEWKSRLAPDAPSLVADCMHPLVWAAASPVWDTGQYRVAVQQAAVALSAHIKKRAGSHLSDRELVQQVLAPEPPRAGQTRLHLPGERADRSWQSRQQGLHLMAQGAFAGIRNTAVHEPVEWNEQEALEHLAVLSVVARWADETSVVANPAP